MPNKTTNLKLNTWLESDVVDFEQVNENFQIIDGLVNCMEAGTWTSTYTDGDVTRTATWYYRKYTNGHVDMYGKLGFNRGDLLCSEGDESPYYSEYKQINYPVTFTSIYHLDIGTSNTKNSNWTVNLTGSSTMGYCGFRLVSRPKETENAYKVVYISVKGRM